MKIWSAILLLLLSQAVFADPRLSVTGNTFEGSAIFVRLTGTQDDEVPSAEWDGENYNFTPTEGGWETVLPLSIDSGGRQRLLVAQSKRGWDRELQVKKRHYGHQSITLSASTLAGYDNPQNKADDQAILDALLADTTERLFSKNFTIPVKAPQTTGFGLRRTYNGWKKGWHKGLDLAGWEGEGVKSPAPGKVIHTARGLVNGNTIVLSHGAGVGTVYFHLNSIQVREGQTVKQGQTIGTVGGTGGFAPHLHWEARVHGVPVHPKVFFTLPKSWRE